MLAHDQPMSYDMVGSRSGWVMLVRIFVCNFRIWSSFFFVFRVKCFGPYPTRHLIRSGRIEFFSDGGFIGSCGPWSDLQEYSVSWESVGPWLERQNVLVLFVEIDGAIWNDVRSQMMMLAGTSYSRVAWPAARVSNELNFDTIMRSAYALPFMLVE